MSRGKYMRDDMTDRCGWVIGQQSHSGVAWKLVLEDLGGSVWSQWELHCTEVHPPMTKPRLVVSNGERIQP